MRIFFVDLEMSASGIRPSLPLSKMSFASQMPDMPVADHGRPVPGDARLAGASKGLGPARSNHAGDSRR